MIDLAAFYAAVANEGARPQPHGIDSIEVRRPHHLSNIPNTPLPLIGAADRTSFYQLKTMLAGRGGARHRARDRRAVALCRRQDRHDRRRGRWLVRRLHQRRDRRGLGRLRQRRRQTPFARRQRDRRAGGAADLRADHRGGLGRRHRAEGAAQRPVARGAAPSGRSADRLHERRAGQPAAAASSSISGVGDDGQVQRYPISAVSREDAYDHRAAAGGSTGSEGYWAGPQRRRRPGASRPDLLSGSGLAVAAGAAAAAVLL